MGPIARLPAGFALAIAAMALACGLEPPTRPTVDSISLTATQSGPLSSLGDTIQLTAVAHDGDGLRIPGIGFVFTSSNPKVATVTDGGLVTAVGNGTATIHIAAEAKEVGFEVKVAQVAAQVLVTPASIRVPPAEIPLFHAAAVDARGNPIGAGGPNLVWTTTDPAVATITPNGRAFVNGSAPTGATARAVATFGSVSSTAGGSMTIDPSAVYAETVVASVSGGPTFTALNQAKFALVSASNPRYGDVSSQVVCTWSNSAVDVVDFDIFPRLAPHRNGSATLTATCNGVSGSVLVTVAQEVASISVTTSTGAGSLSITSLGDRFQLVAQATDPGGAPISGGSFTWETDNPSVATMDAGGVVTAVGNGTAHILARATSNGRSNPAPGFPVVVQQTVEFVHVTPAVATITCCTTLQLTAVATDGRGNPVPSAPAATWSSPIPGVATVDANGLVTAVAVGTVSIFAKVQTASGFASIHVN
jgi:uncharacterized protein YjdB